jgi:hypothetical protein
MKSTLNHALKTTTLPNPETQARIQQLKLGVDWHADHFRGPTWLAVCGAYLHLNLSQTI